MFLSLADVYKQQRLFDKAASTYYKAITNFENPLDSLNVSRAIIKLGLGVWGDRCIQRGDKIYFGQYSIRSYWLIWYRFIQVFLGQQLGIYSLRVDPHRERMRRSGWKESSRVNASKERTSRSDLSLNGSYWIVFASNNHFKIPPELQSGEKFLAMRTKVSSTWFLEVQLIHWCHQWPV